MTMRERIARAVYERSGNRSWKNSPVPEKEIYRRDADAALAAMTEPSEAMALAGAYERSNARTPTQKAANVFTAMIDSARNEKASGDSN